MEPQRKYRRSNGVNINNSDIDADNIAGRDINNTINIPPEPKQNEVDRLKGAFKNALASVGVYVFGILAFIALGLYSDANNSGLSCIGIPLVIIFIILAIFSYKVANNKS